MPEKLLGHSTYIIKINRIITLPSAFYSMAIFKKIPSARLIIIFAVVAMLILSFISYIRISRMIELSTQVNHSNLIKLNLQETYSDLSDADSELSKHILTSDISYRERMIEFENKIHNSIQKLKALTTNNPNQSKRVFILDSLIQRRFELMGEELQTNSKDYKEITSVITDCNTQILSIISTLKESENKGLIEMEDSVKRYRAWTPVMIFALEITVIIFLIFAYSRTDKELRIRRSLQKELETQVHFIRAILDNSVDLIIVLDVQSNLVDANKKSRELFGITDAMIGKNIFSLFPIGQNSKSHNAILQALNGEYVHIAKHRALSVDRTLESFFIPLFKGDEVTAAIIIHHDISALVKASEELEVRNEQLLKSNLDLEQFAYVASHDLQEPLRKVITYSNFAEKAKNDPEKLTSYLSKISASAGRMSNLINDVLRFSRASNHTSETESVDLNLVHKQVLQDLELFIEERGATINSVILPIVDGHTQQLSQVFFNLLHNGLKFCDKQPIITVACKTENGFYVISFSDNGIGFDQSYQNQIFELFKIIPNKQKYSGTGIGLAVCKKILNNHNGSITVRSELGKGTTFEIQLPISQSHLKNLISEANRVIEVPPNLHN